METSDETKFFVIYHQESNVWMKKYVKQLQFLFEKKRKIMECTLSANVALFEFSFISWNKKNCNRRNWTLDKHFNRWNVDVMVLWPIAEEATGGGTESVSLQHVERKWWNGHRFFELIEFYFFCFDNLRIKLNAKQHWWSWCRIRVVYF